MCVCAHLNGQVVRFSQKVHKLLFAKVNSQQPKNIVELKKSTFKAKVKIVLF